MTDYHQRFKDRFGQVFSRGVAEDEHGNKKPLYNQENEDILAFIEELRDEWMEETRDARQFEIQRERAALIERATELSFDDNIYGSVVKLKDLLSPLQGEEKLRIGAKRFAQDFTETMVELAGKSGIQEETECCPACSYTVGNGMAGCSNPNGCCHKPRTEVSEGKESEEWIECTICGQSTKNIVGHVRNKHLNP